MNDVVAVVVSILEGKCIECGSLTHITLVEGTPEFLEKFRRLAASDLYETRVWKGSRSDTDGTYTAVCEHCKKTFYAEHIAVSGDWVSFRRPSTARPRRCRRGSKESTLDCLSIFSRSSHNSPERM